MSRSRKKSPFIPVTTSSSEKDDKKVANRRDRRTNRVILANTNDEAKLNNRRTVSDAWTFSKDGKRRIDPEENAKLLRK